MQQKNSKIYHAGPQLNLDIHSQYVVLPPAFLLSFSEFCFVVFFFLGSLSCFLFAFCSHSVARAHSYLIFIVFPESIFTSTFRRSARGSPWRSIKRDVRLKGNLSVFLFRIQRTNSFVVVLICYSYCVFFLFLSVENTLWVHLSYWIATAVA